MIWNIEEATATTSKASASIYPLGVEGGYMHLYEMQTNWNAMMQAVGLSEAKYFIENGKDLLLEEEGANTKFIDRVIAWFEDVIDRLRQVVSKYVTKARASAASSSKFVEKYDKELSKASKTVEATVHDFRALNAASDSLAAALNQDCSEVESDLKTLTASGQRASAGTLWDDSKKIAMYKRVFTGIKIESEADFQAAFRKQCGLGEAETKTVKVAEYFNELRDIDKYVKKATDSMNGLISNINGIIKGLKGLKSKASKEARTGEYGKRLNESIRHGKDACSAAVFGLNCLTKAYLLKAREAKSVVTKAFTDAAKEEPTGKNESAIDLFANVTIL